ncbi:hypothetical protein Vafri_2314 [Volvox africanus]|nr:hypothetical protein Vafri_2314 [Volvox africanus]
MRPSSKVRVAEAPLAEGQKQPKAPPGAWHPSAYLRPAVAPGHFAQKNVCTNRSGTDGIADRKHDNMSVIGGVRSCQDFNGVGSATPYRYPVTLLEQEREQEREGREEIKHDFEDITCRCYHAALPLVLLLLPLPTVLDRAL